MRTRTKVLLGIAAGVVVIGAAGVIGGPIVYANLVNGSAEAEPTLAPTGGATLAPADADGTWQAETTPSPGTGCTRSSGARM